MKTLREYIAEYDPYRTDNPRYVPEDQATLQYARVSVIADDRWIGASLQPRHLTWLEARETDFVQGVENDYRHAEKLELETIVPGRLTMSQREKRAEGSGIFPVLYGSLGYSDGIL